jgi:hypothetical protein
MHGDENRKTIPQKRKKAPYAFFFEVCGAVVRHSFALDGARAVP